MKFATKQARDLSVRKRIAELCSRLRLDTEGITLSVGDSHSVPSCTRARICLPSVRKCGGWEQFARSFLHEFSHATDYLHSRDDGFEECEKRARKFERLIDTKGVGDTYYFEHDNRQFRVIRQRDGKATQWTTAEEAFNPETGNQYTAELLFVTLISKSHAPKG